MEIEKDYLKNEDGVKEVIAKKILKDRNMTYEQRFHRCLIPIVLFGGMLIAVICTVILDNNTNSTLSVQKIAGLVLGCVMLCVILAHKARKTALKGSLYADSEYDWVNAYDDGDEAFNVKYEKGREALEYRTPDTVEEKEENKRLLFKIVPFWFSVYVIGLGGLTVLLKYDAESPLLDQILYGVGCAIAFFFIIFVMVLGGVYSKYRMYKSSKYDEYIRFYQEHQKDSEDE